MKFLSQFLHFDAQTFFAKKMLIVSSKSIWTDFETKQVLGCKLDVVIFQDHTDYKKNPDGNSNRFERFSVKVRQDCNNVNIDDRIELVQAECSVYGEYRNMLSVTCQSVKVIPPKEKNI